MLSFVKRAGVALAALALTAGAALAQNVNARSSYGQVTLNAGFLPDPYVVRVRAGGDVYVTTSVTCQRGGWFANAPDFRLYYNAGGLALSIYIRAPGDTMLLVNDPAGGWHCNDDYQGLDPAIHFPQPMSGRYEIWAGTYNRSRVRNSHIYITEYGPFAR